MNLVFDIETNGLLHDLTKIHCVGIHDLSANESYSFNDEGGAPITRGITMLEEAERIIGHNIINFDIPAICSLYPFFDPKGIVIDTLLLSRLYHCNILDIDRKRRWKDMPEKLYGRHSLESYGHRLGEYKSAIETDWQEWSQEMEDYMMQDVTVTTKLWKHFHPYLSGSR